MNKIDNFLVLSKMCDRNDDSIKAYSGDTNIIDANFGKDGWGSITIAVDNKTISETALNNKVSVMLLIYDSDIFKQIKKEMEGEAL